MNGDSGERSVGETAKAATRRATAHRLMLEARSLLTDAGRAPAIACLDDAIASISVAGLGEAEEERLPHENSPSDAPLVRATGGALAILGTLLARCDLVSMDELGQLFEVFAHVSGSEDPVMGAIVETWAQLLLQAAQEFE